MSFANSLLALLVTLFALVVDAQPPPPALRVTPTTQTPWKAHKKISIGLGVGLGLGLGLPLIIITAYCCRAKPAAPAVPAKDVEAAATATA